MPVITANGCPEFPFFGASYPDATCINGTLFDLDKCDDKGNLYEQGDNMPCPFCQTEAFIKCYASYSGWKYGEIRKWVKALKEKYNYIAKQVTKKRQDMSKIVITGFSNATTEGVTLHLNEKASLKSGNIKNNEFWVSWDKIGELLFDNYASGSVEELNELRKPKEPIGDKKLITVDEAIALLPEGEYIHTFRNPSGALIGADIGRERIIKILNENKDTLEIGGDACRRMKHAIVLTDGIGPLFIANDEAKLEAFDPAK